MQYSNYNHLTRTLFWCIVSNDLWFQTEFPDSTDFKLYFFKEFRDAIASRKKIEPHGMTPKIEYSIEKKLKNVIIDCKYLKSGMSQEKMEFISSLSQLDIETMVLVLVMRNDVIDNVMLGKMVQPIKPKKSC